MDAEKGFGGFFYLFLVVTPRAMFALDLNLPDENRKL